MWGRVFVLAGGFAAVLATQVEAGDPSVTARAAVIVDAATGETIWERNADVPLPPASTTKVLTAILAIESGRLDDWVTASPEAAETAPSKIGLRPGERMALNDLLYAVLLNSANDAATVVAEGLAGSETEFAIHMNAKARAIGAQNSHFVNPHGLTAAGHVSTARDLAKIFRYGLRLPQFREILETPRIKVPVKSSRISSVSLHSHNRLLTGWQHRVIGKTGYTRPAGRCFVGAATADGREVIIALLGSSDLWGDARRLVAHAFGEPNERPVVQMASASRRRRARAPQITEGDEDVAEQFKRGDVHIASVDRRGTRGAGATRSRPSVDRFTVRLGPYETHREAENAKSRLAKRGYRARIVGQALMLGEFPSRNGADRFAKGLKSKGYRPTIVGAR
jgi:D-alanyl-D-alanine carboxypeptidase (penicillin-binding protein 5/6)